MQKIKIFIIVAALVTIIISCKEETVPDELDCSTIEGATFSSDGGKITNLLATRCGISGCHAVGGAGTEHWTYYDIYDSLSLHFADMYEAAIIDGIMPPDTATALTENELDLFKCFEEAGFPE